MFFYAGFLVCLYFLVRDRLNQIESLLLVSLFAFNPLLLEFLDQILSDIPFLFFSTLSLVLITWQGKRSLLHSALIGAAIFFTASAPERMPPTPISGMASGRRVRSMRSTEVDFAISGSFLARDQQLMIELLADMLQRPRLDPGQFATLRARQIQLVDDASRRLTRALGERLHFPVAFVGRGDMSRGGLLLRAVDAGRELDYGPVAGAVRHGTRPPRLEPRRPPEWRR